MLSHSGFNYSWDACFNDKLKIADLDENEILKTVRLGVESGRLPETIGSDIPTILEKFNLYEEGRLKHAAAVLFARDEMMDYSQCLLRLARFKGIDKTVFMDNQRVSGNIFRLLDAAMAFLFKHLSLSATTDALERTEQLTVPYRALREAVINALCHRTYGNFSESVSIAIYDDRLEIINPGALPMGWDLAKLKSSHDSKPSNPLIASVLYKRRVLENWGRGIRLMLDECIQAGLPEPDFQFDCGDFILTFRYKEALSAAGTTPDKHPTSTRQVPDKYPTSTRQVVEAIGEHKYSVKDLMTAMNLKDRENFLDNYLNPAVEAGLVVPLYPDQPKHPRQKYLLTEKGKQLLS
jgi:ATP-dependent DNA helicase RecG